MFSYSWIIELLPPQDNLTLLHLGQSIKDVWSKGGGGVSAKVDDLGRGGGLSTGRPETPFRGLKKALFGVSVVCIGVRHKLSNINNYSK